MSGNTEFYGRRGNIFYRTFIRNTLPYDGDDSIWPDHAKIRRIRVSDPAGFSCTTHYGYVIRKYSIMKRFLFWTFSEPENYIDIILMGGDVIAEIPERNVSFPREEEKAADEVSGALDALQRI